MRKSYPAGRAGMRRLSRDLTRDIPPVRVPVQAIGYPIPPHPPMPSVVFTGTVVNVSGNGLAVAVGDGASARQGTAGTEEQLVARLEEVIGRLDELDLEPAEQDEVRDAVDAARRIAGEQEFDRGALVRRAQRVLTVLGRVSAATTAGVLAHELAGPIHQLLT